MSLFAALANLVLIRGPVTLRVSEEAEGVWAHVQ